MPKVVLLGAHPSPLFLNNLPERLVSDSMVAGLNRCPGRGTQWCVLLVCILLCPNAQAQEGKGRLLQQPIDLELLETRAKIELELDGSLVMEDRREKKPDTTKKVPVKAKVTQDYFEAVAFQDNTQKAAARKYRIAKIDNWVAGKQITHSLNSERTMTRIVQRAGSWDQYCPTQPMDRHEVELLRSPINTMMLERILPTKPARSNATWTLTEEDIRCLLNLEAVHKSTVTAKVAGVENGTVTIELSGILQGSADSVPTEIELRGSAHAKPSSKGVLITWLGVSIKERREISQRCPGFELTARVQIIRQEQPGQLEVPREQLLELAAKDDPTRWLTKLESIPGKFETFADRNWITYIDGSEDSILRLIENNQSIAQCNIAQLTKLDAGKQLTVEGLEADIRKALGKQFVELVESSEKLTTNGLRLVRIEVSGMEEEVPVRWIYAHVSDDSGRRLALVFTLAAQYSDQFAGNDVQMLDNLQFTGSGSQEPQQSAQAATPSKR